MKVLAVLEISATANREEVVRRLNDELRASWKLFEQNMLRESYATDNPGRVVFVFETSDLTAARAALRGLPLVEAKCFDIQLIELRPFTNWSRLFAS